MKRILSVFLVFVSFTAADAQVVVAPTVVFLSDQSPFGTFLVMNRSDVPQEIGISFKFGYPVFDSLGGVSMVYDDTLMAHEHSCLDWLKGFPQKFVLNPGQEQVVRLLGMGPANAADGEYWTRLVTSSTPRRDWSTRPAQASGRT